MQRGNPFSSLPFRPESVTRPEQKRREQYTYTSPDERSFAVVDATYSKTVTLRDSDDQNREVHGRLLDSLIIRNPDDADTPAIDLVDLCALNGVSIIVCDDYSPRARYYYDAGKNAVVVPPLHSSTAVLFALHELGHAAGEQDPQLAGYNQLYRKSNEYVRADFSAIEPAEITMAARSMAEVPVAEQPIYQELVDRLTPLMDTLLRASWVQEQLRRQKMQHSAQGEQVEHDVVLAESAVKKFLQQYSIKDIMTIPVRVVEKAATRWAMQMANKVKKITGVDLTQDSPVPEPLQLINLYQRDCMQAMNASSGQAGLASTETLSPADAALFTKDLDALSQKPISQPLKQVTAGLSSYGARQTTKPRKRKD